MPSHLQNENDIPLHGLTLTVIISNGGDYYDYGVGP